MSSAEHAARCILRSTEMGARVCVRIPTACCQRRAAAGEGASLGLDEAVRQRPFASDTLPILFGLPWFPSNVNISLRLACS